MLKSIIITFTAISLTACGQDRQPVIGLEVMRIPGRLLEGNPAGDPPARRVAVFSPKESKAAIPLVLYLPGWGGSSEDSISRGTGDWLAAAAGRLAAAGHPVRIASVDARSRYGGSQYLDSNAVGNYATWLEREVMPAIEARYSLPPGAKWIVAGHSSGGFGALRLGMKSRDSIGAIVALSPDSDLENTHIGFARDASVRAITSADVEAATAPAPGFRMPRSGTAQMMLGLAANYAPSGKPGQFEWLYDGAGKWRPESWQRWIDQDPLTMVRKNASAFAESQRIYLDGAEHDEFGANIGARKIYEILKNRKGPVTFLETPGHHNDLLVERLVRGIVWARGGNPPDLRPR